MVLTLLIIERRPEPCLHKSNFSKRGARRVESDRLSPDHIEIEVIETEPHERSEPMQSIALTMVFHKHIQGELCPPVDVIDIGEPADTNRHLRSVPHLKHLNRWVCRLRMKPLLLLCGIDEVSLPTPTPDAPIVSVPSV